MSDGTTPLPQREAVVYLPGMSAGTERRSSVGVVARLTRALDTRAQTPDATWRVEWSDAAIGASGAPDATKPIATILRKDGADECPVIDVFEYAWSKRLLADWEGQSLFRRALRVLFGLVNIFSIWRRFGAARKSVRGWAQLFVATVMLVAMVLYAGSLVFAVVQTGAQVWDSTVADDSSPPTADDKDDNGDDEQGVTLWQRVAIIGGLLMAALKKQGDRLRAGGGALFAADDYIRLATRKQQLMGDLRDLCEALAESRTYSCVRIIGYSFGAIVAIDALFPTTGPPPRALGAVRSLATIGAPYDFVRAVRKTWDKGRHAAAEPARWVNVYSPIDLLGSNFRDDSQSSEATRGVDCTVADTRVEIAPTDNLAWDLGVELTFKNLVVLKGFTSHGDYWGDDGEASDDNVFDLLVTHLYDGSPVLA